MLYANVCTAACCQCVRLENEERFDIVCPATEPPSQPSSVCVCENVVVLLCIPLLDSPKTEWTWEFRYEEVDDSALYFMQMLKNQI